MSITPGEMKTFGVAALGMAGVILAPVTVTALIVMTVAWWRGWSPTRARFLVPVGWTLPAAVWLLGFSPADLSTEAWDLVEQQAYAMAWVPLLPWLVPLGLTVGAAAWAGKWNLARNGVFRSPLKAGVFFDRQHEFAMRRARREARRPGLVPMTTRSGDPVLGRVGHVTETGAGPLVPADPRLFVIPSDAWARHIVVVGETGAGKTKAIERLCQSWSEGAWLRHVMGAGDRPLLILVECKGGADGTVTARQFEHIGRSLGLAHGRIGRWPTNVRFDLWTLPPNRLFEVLTTMVRSSDPYWEDMRDELIGLAVFAPDGPPMSSVELLQRLDPEWLLRAYGADRPLERETIRENRKAYASSAARYRTLFRHRIGRSFDSGRHVDDFDALILTLEGTENPVTASAQAQAFIELVTDLGTRGGPSGSRRQVLMVIDEFSAISERVPIAPLMERARTCGIAVVPAAQSWHDLGRTEHEQSKLVSAAAGGMLALGTSDPGHQISRFAGRRIVVDATIRDQDDGGTWGDGSMGRASTTDLVPPEWLSRLGRHAGQAVWIRHGRAVWGVLTPVEVTAGGLALLPSGGVQKAVECLRTAVLTRGDRIPIRELEAGLSGPSTADDFGSEFDGERS